MRALTILIVLAIWHDGLNHQVAFDLPPFVCLKPFAIEPADSDLLSLQKRLANSASDEMQLRYKAAVRTSGHKRYDTFIDVGMRVVESRLALCATIDCRIELLRQYIAFREEQLTIDRARYAAGTINQSDLTHSNSVLLYARIMQDSSQTPIVPSKPEVSETTRTSPAVRQDDKNQIAKATGERKDMPVFIIAQSVPTTPGDTAIRKLLIDLSDSATSEMKLRYIQFLEGKGAMEALWECAGRTLNARLGVVDNGVDRRRVTVEFRDLTIIIEDTCKKRLDQGTIAAQDYERCRYERLKAQIAIECLKNDTK